MSDEPKRIDKVLPDVFDLRKYSGIETTYRGIEFRSRLEARWCCMFDQLGWRWNYEPFDYPGWLPDFLIGQNLLVEVKPFTQLSEFDAAIAKAKAAMGDDARELLLVGQSPFMPSDLGGPPYCVAIGWIGEVVRNGDHWEWAFDFAPFGRPYIEKNHSPTLCSANGSFRDRISGVDAGTKLQPNDDWEWTQALWANACNLTKWKPPKNDRHGYR